MLHSNALAQTEHVEPIGDLRSELASLRGENAALQSLLYGLFSALAQMSDVQREVVLQAMDFADRSPIADELGDGAQAHARAVARFRGLVITRIRPMGL